MAKVKGKHVSEKAQNDSYKLQNRREINKKRKLAKHMLSHPTDLQSRDRVVPAWPKRKTKALVVRKNKKGGKK